MIDSHTPPVTQVHPHITVRRMGLADLGFVVAQHLEHFPDNVFGQLGDRFLTEYYRTFLDGPHADARIAISDGVPVGFLVGILDVAEHRRLVRRYHARRLAWHAARALSLRPRMAFGLLRRRAQVWLRRNNEAGRSADGSVAVLSHVAVDLSSRGYGTGTTLILGFVDAATTAGAVRVALATRAGDLGAGRLYESLGWQLARERSTFDGRRIALYDLDLPAPRLEGDR